jgi:hypothetical protein
VDGLGHFEAATVHRSVSSRHHALDRQLLLAQGDQVAKQDGLAAGEEDRVADGEAIDRLGDDLWCIGVRLRGLTASAPARPSPRTVRGAGRRAAPAQ